MQPYVVIEQALMCGTPQEELEMLQQTGTLAHLYPEVHAMVGFGGGQSGHKDLWWHTKLVVAQTIERPEVRWAALFHDVGKVPTFSREKGKVTFHGHEMMSARLFDKAARRTGLPSAFRKHVRDLVRHLGQVESYESHWTDSAVRRLHKQLAPVWDDVVALACADITTKHAHKRRAHQKRMRELDERAKAIAEADASLPLLPKGLGRVIIEALELTPGPEVGRVMKKLEAAVEAGTCPARAEPEVYVAFLKACRTSERDASP
ncbi:MAG: HD domain-containing protein [Myxococcota bacterium]